VLSLLHFWLFGPANWPPFFQDGAKIDFTVQDLVLQKLNAKKDLTFKFSPPLGAHDGV
jgi:hypothetical protein